MFHVNLLKRKGVWLHRHSWIYVASPLWQRRLKVVLNLQFRPRVYKSLEIHVFGSSDDFDRIRPQWLFKRKKNLSANFPVFAFKIDTTTERILLEIVILFMLKTM